MKINQEMNIMVNRLLLISLAFMLVNCTNYMKLQEKREVRRNVKKFEQNQELYFIDSILIDTTKYDVFIDYMNNKWNRTFSKHALLIGCICEERDYYRIGLYTFKPNASHFYYTHYFLNYKEKAIILDKNDTIGWNSELNKFYKFYETQLSEINKQILQSRIIKTE